MMNGKKKVLIVNNNLATGGVQRALINLLKEIRTIYDVTLFLFSNSGGYRSQIPEGVQVIEASQFLELLGISQAQSKEKGLFYYLLRGGLALYTKLLRSHDSFRLLAASQEKLTDYDVAISFLHNVGDEVFYGGCNEFVLERVSAKEKISFLHCDFLNSGGNTHHNRALYRCFDKIVAVSEGCRQSFVQALPELVKKTYCVYNCHNYEDYLGLAQERTVVYPKDSLNIITVARLSEEKGILRGIEVIDRLIKEGRLLRWVIVGGGRQLQEILEKINHSDLSKYIFLCGNQENPYRYMKNADLLLLPSFHEAAPMVINEAKCLGLPVLTTRTTSVDEMVLEGKEGFISENSLNGLYQSLRSILDNPEVLQGCREYLQKQIYNNERALRQFCCLLEEGSYVQNVMSGGG